MKMSIALYSKTVSYKTNYYLKNYSFNGQILERPSKSSNHVIKHKTPRKIAFLISGPNSILETNPTPQSTPILTDIFFFSPQCLLLIHQQTNPSVSYHFFASFVSLTSSSVFFSLLSPPPLFSAAIIYLRRPFAFTHQPFPLLSLFLSLKN